MVYWTHISWRIMDLQGDIIYPLTLFSKKNEYRTLFYPIRNINYQRNIYIYIYIYIPWNCLILIITFRTIIMKLFCRIDFRQKFCLKLHKKNFLFMFILSCSIKSLNNGHAQLYYCNVVNTKISINGNRINGAWQIIYW